MNSHFKMILKMVIWKWTMDIWWNCTRFGKLSNLGEI